jgi:phosphoglycerate dehydrogenase-like enzyme
LKNMKEVGISLVNKPEARSRRLPKKLIESCDILFCTFPPKNYEDMRNLKMIQIASSGYTQLTGLGLVRMNIKACNALGVFDVPIAEWNIAMMINLKRDIRKLINNQENGIWDRSPSSHNELRDAVVGIWGYGGIGRETARFAKTMGMKVHVLTRSGLHERKKIYRVPETGDPQGKFPDEVFLMKDKEKFLSELDFLVMAIPLNKHTEGIVGEEELRTLGSNTYLLNPARGPLIKEKALIHALQKGWIAGAAIDTHYHYPMPADHPLWGLRNIIMTPHISGLNANPNFLKRIWAVFVQNVINFIDEKPLLNELNPSQLEED